MEILVLLSEVTRIRVRRIRRVWEGRRYEYHLPHSRLCLSLLSLSTLLSSLPLISPAYLHRSLDEHGKNIRSIVSILSVHTSHTESA